MTTKEKTKVPSAIVQFLRDLEGALGDRFVGAILFGSWANDEMTAESDLDLAVIVSDADGDQSRQEVFRVFGVSELDRNRVSLSVETYMRLKEFLNVGDPFAWVVCRDGRVLAERRDLLTDLQKQAKESTKELDASGVMKYLQGKSYTHYVQAVQAFQQFLSHLQLSVMAGAQAVSAHSNKGKISGSDLIVMSKWETLKSTLQATSATKREIETLEQLIMAHKNARRTGTEFPGKGVLDMIGATGELWKRLLPQGQAGRNNA